MALEDFMAGYLSATTCTAEDLKAQPSVREMITGAEKLLREPRLIGTLFGFPVYVDPSADPGVIEIRGGANGTVRFAVDHPFINGQEIQSAALKALPK